ncbi:chaplin [Streptomyces sp. NBC_01537]|uniref:chaplin n=1 Tax=Streptomyces sp. NBC_01537 TaxID=2903896 RepID=UPI0038659331
MKRLSKAAVLTVAAGAAVLGTAGGAVAHDGHGHGSSADAIAAGSPGVVSGNVIQVPIHVPINLCGNTVNGLALLNPAIGNTCVNA